MRLRGGSDVSLVTAPRVVSMRPAVVCLSVLLAACASSSADPSPVPDSNATPGTQAGCYSVMIHGTPASDVQLPTLIQLSHDPAPNFVEPGRLAIREPGAKSPLAPISWWIPRGNDAMELVLGGGFTGYSFDLRSAEQGAWVGPGTYCADFGVEPTPESLSIRLVPRSCP